MTAVSLRAGPLLVLAVGAHPDDIEIGCGATLLTLLARGAVEVRTLVLTGTPEREQEARDAADAFGTAHPVFGRLPDTRLPEHWGEVKDTLHDFRDAVPTPDLVFAPRPDDAHQDHRLLGTMVPTVWRGPLVLHYEIPKWDGDFARPNMYIPVEPQLARRKVELLNRAYPSRHGHEWWDDEFFLAIMRLRGAETQSRYAEAYTTAKCALWVHQP